MQAEAEQRVAFEQSLATRAALRECVVTYFERYGQPWSIADIGCGHHGFLEELSMQAGIQCEGLDAFVEGGEVILAHGGRVWQADLTEPQVPRIAPASLTLCLEVAEHLPESAAETLCQTLADFTAAGGRLVFSAAIPGQGGSGHLNEQPHGYWVEKLTAFELDPGATNWTRLAWREAAPQAWWYGQNVMVFNKE